MAVNLGRARPVAVVAALAACGLMAAACSSSGGSGSSSASSAAPSSAGTQSASTTANLGTAHPATGSPVVFGLLNLLSGPVTFPEVSEAEQAAAAYANQYLGGIGGHPIKIVTCATDGQPATSAALRQPAAERPPGGHPGRRRHRRAGRHPGVAAGQPGLPGRRPVHPGRVQLPQRGHLR